MIVSLILGLLIFGYAGWTLYRFVQKSKKGKCATCSLSDHCQVCEVSSKMASSIQRQN